MITDDLGPFFGLAEFAEPCTINARSGVGIFSTPYLAAQLDPLTAVESADAILLVRAADFPALALGQSVSVRSVSYVIYGPPEPDGTGLTSLRLRRT